MSDKAEKSRDEKIGQETVKIEYVNVSTEEEGHLVVLKETAEARGRLEMYVGASEFAAIAKELGMLDSSRPLTHELYTELIDGLEIDFDRIEIYDLNENAYLARLVYTKMGEETTAEIRPSDGVALALRRELPILLHKRLLKGTLSATDQATLSDLVKTVKF